MHCYWPSLIAQLVRNPPAMQETPFWFLGQDLFRREKIPGEGIGCPVQYSWASPVAQLVKNPPAMQKTWIWSLGWEDPLEKERLPTPVFWPGEFHGWYSSWGRKELDTTERFSLSLSSPGLDENLYALPAITAHSLSLSSFFTCHLVFPLLVFSLALITSDLFLLLSLLY